MTKKELLEELAFHDDDIEIKLETTIHYQIDECCSDSYTEYDDLSSLTLREDKNNKKFLSFSKY